VLLEGEHTVRRLEKRSQGWYLCTKKDSESGRLITEEMDFEIWGVVSHAIHKYL
jgi:SOS-response transcriptional repressor LexA